MNKHAPTRKEYEAHQRALFSETPPPQALAKVTAAAPEFKRQQCRGCPTYVVFAANTETSKQVPLDDQALVYAVRVVNGSTVCIPSRAWVALRNEKMTRLREKGIAAGWWTIEEWNAMGIDSEGVAFKVTHFATCKKPAAFSGRNADDKAREP